jgi:isopentenyl-diphosphate delta-isomerase
MTKVTQTSSRKSNHIRINLEEDVRSGLSTGLGRYRFEHQALPELDLAEVDLRLNVFGRKMNAPILISSMTGGTQEAAKINQNLAAAAQEARIAMGLGSQRAALENPELAYTFQVRKYAPDILLFANIGAVQLNYGYGIEHCYRAIEMVDADALILHLNALQEAVQPEGDTNFSGLLSKIEKICAGLSVPVVAKEVGWGISENTARQLADAGIAAIDVAGAGGTSWSQVELHRATSENQARLAAAFIDWGIPTSDSILNVCNADKSLKIFASGGIRNGVDISKSLALGATLGGMAGLFLKAASISQLLTFELIEEIKREIQVSMFAAGVRNLSLLSKINLNKM